jgi:cell division protein FtsN
MVVFLGGVAAAFLGLLGIIIWHHAVVQIIMGAIPLILLIGGLMAAYLSYDEVKEKLPCCKARETQEPSNDAKLREEAERYKQEAERLQSELDKTTKPARKSQRKNKVSPIQ